ncbi:MAG: hypothetical protein SO360_04705 [Bifidobacterium tsurumiense]|uniref:hypothetical protein n=1 Tax=Bifidobacterium tsurumiense TaxID=356829 RepID=UPI002A805F4C|nr:hypothetical protein [Bifidobacterium tsurumiense]MDY4678142.1 hypothetical protein [Bifidobacterium tsurumiense]
MQRAAECGPASVVMKPDVPAESDRDHEQSVPLFRKQARIRLRTEKNEKASGFLGVKPEALVAGHGFEPWTSES